MRAVEAINRAFDGIYGERDGSVWILRKSKALITVIVSAIAAVILGLCILLAPSLIKFIEDFTNWDIPTNITFMRYAVGVVVFYVLMWTLHWFLPNHHAQGFPALAGCAVFHHHLAHHGDRIVVLSRLFWGLFCHLRRIGWHRHHNAVPLLFRRNHTIWCRTKRSNRTTQKWNVIDGRIKEKSAAFNLLHWDLGV